MTGETQEKASKVPGRQNLPVLGSLRAPQVCLGAQPHHARRTTGAALERGADCRPLNGRAGEPRAMSCQEGWSRRGPPEHHYQRPVLPRGWQTAGQKLHPLPAKASPWTEFQTLLPIAFQSIHPGSDDSENVLEKPLFSILFQISCNGLAF